MKTKLFVLVTAMASLTASSSWTPTQRDTAIGAAAGGAVIGHEVG